MTGRGDAGEAIRLVRCRQILARVEPCPRDRVSLRDEPRLDAAEALEQNEPLRVFIHALDQLGLIPALLDAIRERGFVTPARIQAEMIPFLLTEERDVTGLAQTGTGKTAAFGLAILQQLDLQSRSTQALGIQVAGEIADYGRNLPGLRTTAVYGGAPFGPPIGGLHDQGEVSKPVRFREIPRNARATFPGPSYPARQVRSLSMFVLNR